MGMQLEMTPEDREKLAPCPFCGETDGLEVTNTHTPSYWVECICGARMDGEYFEPRRNASKASLLRLHEKAKASVIDRWNRRAVVG